MLYIHQLLNGIWMMNPDYAANYIPLAAAYLRGEQMAVPVLNQENSYNSNNGVQFSSFQSGAYQIIDGSRYHSPENAPEDSIAILSINGAMTKYDQYCGPSGMQTKSNLLERCYANTNIQGVVLKVDSGGGESRSWRLMKETIAERNKAIIGFVDDCACSAAYGLLSCCDLIVANNELAEIGSIGSYATILDYRKKLKKEGVDLIEVYASQSTDKNLEFREALNGNMAPLQAKIDVLTDDFINHVATARSGILTNDRKTWATGKTFFAKEALELGLIDKIDSFNNILNYFK